MSQDSADGIKKLANKQLLVFLMILISAFLLSISISYAQVASPSDTQTFQSAKTGIKFQYPSDWTVKASNEEGNELEKNVIGGIYTLKAPTPGVFLNIDKEVVLNSNNLKGIAEFGTYDAKGTSYVLQEKPITLNEKPAYMVLYKLPDDNNRRLNIVTADDQNKIYLMISYTAPENQYDGYLTQVSNIIKSIQVSK